jgi:calcium-dependent protein kinase
LVIEYIEGGELFGEIEKRKMLTERMAADIIKQLLSAIIYCHKRNIAHRDLKLENILLAQSNEDQIYIKVIDFGTAELFDSYTKFRYSAGTIYYLAPEVLMGCYDEKCDIWSCGVILYILLSGSPPFNGATPELIMEAISNVSYNFASMIFCIRKYRTYMEEYIR